MFAVVYYADSGNRQRLGLRLDMDKRVFLDHLDDPEKDLAVANSAEAVADAVGEALRESRMVRL